METVKEFLINNMPNTFRACFTVVRKEGRAYIAGRIVMCDCLDNILEQSGLMELPSERLHQIAGSLNILQPERRQFSQAVDLLSESEALIA